MTNYVSRGKSSKGALDMNTDGYQPRRRYERLPVAIPVFVRGTDEKRNEFVEFTTAMNLNAGGLLLVSRHALPSGLLLTVEIPTPTPFHQPPGTQTRSALPARVLYSRPSKDCHLCGLEFTTPLLPEPLDPH